MTRMSVIDPRTPCLIGVAQETVRPPEGPAPEPLESWERVARAAAEDAGAPSLLADLDSVQVVYCHSWPYDDPVGRLVERLGADPKHRLYSGIGGTTPQVLLNDAATSILNGDASMVLVVGAEALATKRALKKAGERPAWSHRDPEKKPFPFEAIPHASEIAHEVFQAYLTFALFDVARRARLGMSSADYSRAIGETLAPMTKVAAANPHAWFPVERTAEELMTPMPDNRLVASPYTKHAVSIIDVEMAAAVVLASHERADSLGVPAERRVYLRGWSYATDPWVVAERADLSRSVAMREVSRAALAMAGLTVDDIGHLDLYSCFASSLHFACDALGIEPSDPRGLTVTGGLPFAGGPASNYMLHSVAAMAEVLRADPGSAGLVSGVGMHMTKHAYAVYSTTPGTVAPSDKLKVAQPRSDVVESYAGPATVATYSVVHGRDGAPEWGLLVIDLPAGGRGYARVSDPALLADAAARELVGAVVTVTTDGRVNTATW